MDSENFLDDLLKYTKNDDKSLSIASTNPNTNNENIEDMIKNMESDQGLINIIKSYQNYEKNKSNFTEDKDNSKINNISHTLNENNELISFNDSALFSNCMIQSSFTRFNILKKVLLRKQNTILIFYLDKWRIKIKNKQSKLIVKTEEQENSNYYLLKNRKIIEAYCDDDVTESYTSYPSYPAYSGSSGFDYLNLNNLNINFTNNYDLPLQSPRLMNKNLTSEIKIAPSKKNLCLALKNILHNKFKNSISQVLSKFQLYMNSKKLANSSLSLLYIFTELAISKSKNKKITQQNNNQNNFISNNSNSANILNTNKLTEYEKKISKYEACLNEKADIIASRNDRIEQQIETIELLTEEINRLNLKIENLEKRSKNLNIVEESLCSKCNNSLEESFMSHKEPSTPKKQNENEYRITIQEQLDYIIKMENENKDFKIKNNDFRTNNEMILNELEVIKSEFRILSESFNKKNSTYFNILNKTDNSTQTSESTLTISNPNKKQPIISTTTTTNSLKKSSSKFSSKLNIKNSQSDKKESNMSSTSSNSSITNYNIININSTSNVSTGRLSNNNSSALNCSMNEGEKEIIQSLRFDNSILTQEIVNLNKELNKIKNEFKHISEINKKIEKEKNDLNTKFKSKAENFDKIKKENEELMILIQTSNYKSFISVESENKKLKNDYLLINKDFENLKHGFLLKDKKLIEIEIDLEKNKKLCDSLFKYKNEREDLILENAKLDSELKQLKYEGESSKTLTERLHILLKKQDETITKLNEDMTYLNFNAKKSKVDTDRALQDASAYQQIVRKLERDLIDTQSKKDKVENELNIIKGQLGIRR